MNHAFHIMEFTFLHYTDLFLHFWYSHSLWYRFLVLPLYRHRNQGASCVSLTNQRVYTPAKPFRKTARANLEAQPASICPSAPNHCQKKCPPKKLTATFRLHPLHRQFGIPTDSNRLPLTSSHKHQTQDFTASRPDTSYHPFRKHRSSTIHRTSRAGTEKPACPTVTSEQPNRHHRPSTPSHSLPQTNTPAWKTAYERSWSTFISRRCSLQTNLP